MKLIRNNFPQRLAELLTRASGEIVISTPFLSDAGSNLLIDSTKGKFQRKGTLHFVTNLSPKNILQSATDPASLLRISSEISDMRLRHLPRLHAKAYIADRRVAIITSANLTAGGLYHNYEYGVEIDDEETVNRIRDDIVEYSELGAAVDRTCLDAYCKVAQELRETYRQTQSKVSAKFDLRVRDVEDSLIRLRLAGGSMTGVFEKTIVYLLRIYGPLATVELHPKITEIHPDLCDDAVDRVIDGRHYGKKWKHAVRAAQSHLKTARTISFDGQVWRLREQV